MHVGLVSIGHVERRLGQSLQARTRSAQWRKHSFNFPGVTTSMARSIRGWRVASDLISVEQLAFKYPGMFSPGQRCDPPMVNIDNMRDRIYGAGVLKRHELTSSKMLLEWLVETNNLLAIKYESNESERRSIPSTAWTKASQNRFYLGLESLWYYT